MTDPVFGLSFTRVDNEPRPVIPSDMSTLFIVGTAPGANADAFALNECKLINTGDGDAVALLGSTGTIPDAIRGVNDQLGDFQVGARAVIVRVAEGANADETIANLVGVQASFTGIYALLLAGKDLGVVPRLGMVPGFTHQTKTGVLSVAITNDGSAYTTAPTVSFTGGGGSGAVGTATIEDGQVTGVTITNPGSGYTSAPTVSFTGGEGSGAAATATVGLLANPVCAALPSVLSKLLAHAIVEGPGTSYAAIVSWRETLLSERLIPIDMWVKVQEGASIVTKPGAPRVAGIGVRRDFEKRGVPGHSWANQPVQGIVGFARNVEFNLTDGSVEGQTLLGANVGIGARGEMGVENAISSSGFVFIGTDNAADDPIWQMYNVTRMRDYIHLGLMRATRYYLGKYNINGHTIQAVINTAKFWLRDLAADDHILGYDVGFEPNKNSPENLRLGRFRYFFKAEEAPVLKRVDADSMRHREALTEMLEELLEQASFLTV